MSATEEEPVTEEGPVTKEEFVEAQERVQQLRTRPSNDALLTLYALYKQATIGDVQGKRPGMLDLKGRAKYAAWAAQRGKAAEAARAEYVAWVTELVRRDG